MVSCTATDGCGNESTCAFGVVVNAVNEVALDISLSGILDTPPPLMRCITLELFECSNPTEVEIVELELDFAPSDGDGSARFNGVVEVPCGAYTCLTARDKLHTLRRTLDEANGFGISGTQYVADFLTPGKDLIGGNLNDDIFIDILDFGIFVGQFGLPIGGSDCLTIAPHADIDGNGVVFTEDFTFISVNFFSVADNNCCGAAASNMASTGSDVRYQIARQGREGPITRISVSELRRLGLIELIIADLNDDGWVDEEDMAAFMSGARP